MKYCILSLLTHSWDMLVNKQCNNDGQRSLAGYSQWDHKDSDTTEHSVQFSRSVMSDSATPWIAARQASLSSKVGALITGDCGKHLLTIFFYSEILILKPGKALSNKNEVCQGARKSQVATLDLS